VAWWLAWDPALTPVGGSDWHRPGADAPPGSPTTWVEVDAEAGEEIAGTRQLLAALAAGRTAISAGRDGPVLRRCPSAPSGGAGRCLVGRRGGRRGGRTACARQCPVVVILNTGYPGAISSSLSAGALASTPSKNTPTSNFHRRR